MFCFLKLKLHYIFHFQSTVVKVDLAFRYWHTVIGIRQVELHLSRCAFPSFYQKISMDKELFFRKICQICKTPAPPNGKVSIFKAISYRSFKLKNMFQHYFHYGAICCSKCKAFFRRCTRNADKYGPIANVFPCLSGTNNCELNYLGRVNCDLREFKCKKCRLRKCLDAGMYCTVGYYMLKK